MEVQLKDLEIQARNISHPFTKEPLAHSQSPENDPELVLVHIVTFLPSQLQLTGDDVQVASELENLHTEAGELTVRKVTISGSYEYDPLQTHDLWEIKIQYNLQGQAKAQAIFVEEKIDELYGNQDPETTRGTVTTPKII